MCTKVYLQDWSKRMIEWLIKDSINPAIIEVFNALFTQAINVLLGAPNCALLMHFKEEKRWQSL